MARTLLRRTAGIVAVVGALSLGGCSSDGGGSVAEPSSAATSASPAPSPSASRVVVKPVRPAAMDDDGPAGAEAAAKYFLELDSYMQASGDTSEWEGMSHESCEYCAKRLDQARQIVANGDTFEGGEAAVEVLHTYAQDGTTGIWPIDVRVHETATKITSASGEVAFSNAKNVYSARIELGRQRDSWVIVELGNTKPQ
ncbi:DUF6318 family protein [Xylanimonas sp. McL0601]|uniref:DUF6318 family protein n=1 Tax=Xylanimonas sp. McL0601 TaxID=3414739 RepID=UPI003CEDE030